MKKIFFLASMLILKCCGLYAQNIQNILAYFRPEGTRYIAQLSNNTIWWFDKTQWQEIPRENLPEKPIKFIDAYLKISLGSVDTRIVCVLEDNSIWWHANDKDWTQLKNEGLPSEQSIKDFRAYVKTGTMGATDTRLVVVLNDNSVWWFDSHKWKNLSLKGIPENMEIRFLRTYQKTEVIGGPETRYIVKLKDHSLWWCGGSKWKKFECTGIPCNQAFKQFEVYMKSMGGGGLMPSTQEGRFIAVLEDNSMWWTATNSKSWTKLSSRGLPEGFNIKSFKTYQKYGGLTGESRLLVLLEDGTLWWYADGKAWTGSKYEWTTQKQLKSFDILLSLSGLGASAIYIKKLLGS